jgi:hypothetical protein
MKLQHDILAKMSQFATDEFKSKFVGLYLRKAHGAVEVQILTFLSLELDGDK